MATEILDDIADDAPASALRDRLGQEVTARRAVEDELSTYKTRDLLDEKGFDLVKPEDLKGVAAAEREAKAAEIQESRKALQEELLRKALQAKGLEGDEIEELVSQAVGVQAASTDAADAARRMRAAGQVPGSPVPAVNPDKLHGYDAIRAALTP